MRSGEAKKALAEGRYREKLTDIYVDPEMISYQEERYIKAIEQFEKTYGEQEIEIYSAPGRTEVGGNHTDHQHGQVLAAAVNMDVIAIVQKTDDKTVKILSGTYDIKPISMEDLSVREKEKGTSEALIRGVAAKLFKDGYQIGGFKAYMTSDVIVGAGLSSSAAFEVAVGTILSGLYNDMTISPIYIAQAAQYAENEYFGKPCGLMDQMASSVGSLVNIDFKDNDAPVVKKVEVNFDKFGHSLCIVDTKGDHTDLTPEYAAVPFEMKKVAQFFGCSFLREVDVNEFYRKLPEVRKATGDRGVLRAMHFFADHERVGKQVKALETGDFEGFKKLIIESGESSYQYLQNVFAVTDVQNQSMSIGLALSERYLKGKGAWRVHGGGFAGTVQAFVRNEDVAEYKKNMEECFGKDSCHVLKIRKYGGLKFPLE
ncbi:MAG: galactokinase [Lachnospiraceae bacterium]|nr:galactokinase [Lachnospiraceae bacterium]